MAEEVAYKEIFNCTNIILIIGLGRYLDKAQYELFITVKDNLALIGR
jgi:hypothetical protein